MSKKKGGGGQGHFWTISKRQTLFWRTFVGAKNCSNFKGSRALASRRFGSLSAFLEGLADIGGFGEFGRLESSRAFRAW